MDTCLLTLSQSHNWFNRKGQSVPGRGPLSETLPTSLTFFMPHNGEFLFVTVSRVARQDENEVARGLCLTHNVMMP